MAHPSEELYRRLVSAYKSGDMATISDSMAPDVRWHEAGNPDVIEGRDAMLERMKMMSGLEGDVELHDVLANDEHVVALIRAKFRKPNGVELEYPAVEVAHVRDGKVTERWAFLDATPDDVSEFFADLT